MKFYQCSICGNILEAIHDADVTPECCGVEMEVLTAGETDGATEKHVPVIQISDIDNDKKHVQIKVGEVQHPMSKEHCIEWIILKTDRGVYRKCLKQDEEPAVGFCIAKEECVRAAYAWCNLHGLWVNLFQESAKTKA